jgi:alpha-tubulin suppressor-like RCC1 family protein
MPQDQTPPNGSKNDEKRSIVAIAIGAFHYFVIDSANAVYAIGGNGSGQLGFDDDEPDCDTFTFVDSLSDKKIVALFAGAFHSFALDTDGKVYASGHNEFGQLGLGDNSKETSRKAFTLVSDLSNKKIVAIAAGIYHSLALDSEGNVYATGENDVGQLGLGDKDNRNGFTSVTSLEGKKIVAVSAGRNHSLAIDENGKVYATGKNGEGQLGLDDNFDRNSFTIVSSLRDKKVVAITAGANYALALSSDGSVYATGENIIGELGLGDEIRRNVFTLVSSLSDKNIIAISAGDIHSLALSSKGKVYATGANSYGRLGLNAKKSRKIFTLVPSFSDKKIVAIAASCDASFALDSDGKLYAAGSNFSGQLGLGDKDNRNVFTPVILSDRQLK